MSFNVDPLVADSCCITLTLPLLPAAKLVSHDRCSLSLSRPSVRGLMCGTSAMSVFPSWTNRAAPLKDARRRQPPPRRYLAILTLFGVLSNKLGRRNRGSAT